MGVWGSFKKNGFKYFTPKRAWLFIRSIYRSWRGINIKQKDIVAFSEMVTYRNFVCQECAHKGECIHCGCPMKELTSSVEAACSDGKWPAHDPKDLENNWNTYKEKEGIFTNFLYSK